MAELQIDVAPIERHRRGIAAVERTDALRLWVRDCFRLEIFDIHQTDTLGKAVIAYRFSDSRFGSEPIFEADVSPPDTIDSAARIAALLGILSLRPCDAGEEVFAAYSARQTEWMEQHAEELALCADELREAGR